MSRTLDIFFTKNPDKKIEYEKIKQLYSQGKSLTEICKQSTFERHQLARLLKADNIEIKQNGQKYYYNENAFKNIDNEIDAYWLGYMYADGNINELRMVCDLSMAEIDKSHLEKFRDYISPSKQLIKRESKYSKDSKTFYSYRLYITNKQITQNLIDNNCLWSKTYDVEFPTFIDDKYMPHFIRGFFDGDGCIAEGPKQYNLNFTCANEHFLISLQKYLNINSNMKINKISYDNRSEAKKIQWSAKQNLIDFYNYIYKDATVYLDRKYNKYTQIIAVLSQKSQETQDD